MQDTEKSYPLEIRISIPYTGVFAGGSCIFGNIIAKVTQVAAWNIKRGLLLAKNPITGEIKEIHVDGSGTMFLSVRWEDESRKYQVDEWVRENKEKGYLISKNTPVSERWHGIETVPEIRNSLGEVVGKPIISMESGSSVEFQDSNPKQYPKTRAHIVLNDCEATLWIECIDSNGVGVSTISTHWFMEAFNAVHDLPLIPFLKK
jgi:hypothetical protein